MMVLTLIHSNACSALRLPTKQTLHHGFVYVRVVLVSGTLLAVVGLTGVVLAVVGALGT